jgi:hypothetical protein
MGGRLRLESVATLVWNTHIQALHKPAQVSQALPVDVDDPFDEPHFRLV